MTTPADRIKSGPLLLDGALGTVLMDEGLTAGQCPESINLHHPELLKKVAADYLEAGSDILQTNTFGATPIKLAKYRMDARIDPIITAAVGAVKMAASENTLISGSCGPCGDLLKPYGTREPEEVLESFEEQIRILVREGVDLIHIETMSDLKEARLALDAARKIDAGIPVLVSLIFNPGPRGFHTLMGQDVSSVVRELTDGGSTAIGSNCGSGSEHMISIARELRTQSPLPLVIQPNAGMPVLQGDKTVYPESPEFMAAGARELLGIGVNIIGGCCGSTPAHIRAIRRVMNEYLSR